jgi:hypothetical protein
MMSLKPIQLRLHLHHSSAPTPVLYIKLEVNQAIYSSILYTNSFNHAPDTLHTLSSIGWSHKKLSLAKKLGSVIQLNAPGTKEKAFGNRLANMYYTYIYILKNSSFLGDYFVSSSNGAAIF